MSKAIAKQSAGQQKRNSELIDAATYMKQEVTSSVLPLNIDISTQDSLTDEQIHGLQAVEIEAARIALKSLASLAKINELDHLGGGLDLIPALNITAALTNYESRHFTIEHAHTSIGYYSLLAALGYLNEDHVIEGFRRSLDIPGHVSWVPGGTQLNGGRLGVMIPAAVGQSLGLKAQHGKEGYVICHCGDAGWISGQALNGFNGAAVHGAPITFVMHRNGIQLSGSTKSIMDLDPRGIISSLGIEILEIDSLEDTQHMYAAYREGYQLAQAGKPSLIYPVGYRSSSDGKVTVETLGAKYGISEQVADFAGEHGVDLDTEIWIPGSLMSYRDVKSMLECVFLVNELPGGTGHHDGHMKGRELDEVLANPMLQLSKEQSAALGALRSAPAKTVITKARPAVGSPNLVLSDAALTGVKLPEAGASTSPRAGVQEGYAAVARQYPDEVFMVSCDLDASTKLGKARSFLKPDHQFEMSIEEQVSAIMVNGLSVSSMQPQLNVVSTFAAFYEGIAREGFEMWRYQRNLNGVNEGLNAVMHLSHVGACTGRDHFSGWSLDWITLAIGYLPYLHRFYAPADARAAFIAVKDLAAHYGGHIIGIPRDNLPVLTRQDSEEALWEAGDDWTPVTTYRRHDNASRAVLVMGAPAFMAGQASEQLTKEGCPVDVHIINGLPVSDEDLEKLIASYPDGVVTVEDGIIGCSHTGLRGFAGLVSTVAEGSVPLRHVGITDPRIAPSEGMDETWEHFGITADDIVASLQDLS